MITIDFAYDGNLDTLDKRMKEAIAAKLIELTDLLYTKVIDNLSGKILQKQTGQLVASIRKETDVASEPMTGFVFPSPADDKAWALEMGGKNTYPIIASKAGVLHFFTKSGVEVFAKSVQHPPSKEFAYLRRSLEEMATLVPDGFRDAIEQVIAE